MTTLHNTSESWTTLHKLAFRFMAIYGSMAMFYTWLRFQTIPGLTQLHKFIWPVWRSIVVFFNDYLLHIRETLIDPNSSTDTSLSWASQYTMLIISVVVVVAWSAIDRKRPNYQTGEYWLRTITRYFVAYFCFYYGIIKLFALQMPFPSLSQLSTTLGDLSLTRLAWMFLGASTSYQVFSGVIETAAAIFLMFRRTTTLGLILAVAVFGNVVALNFGYDIPVKLMSSHILLFAIYLLTFEYRRIVDFFFLDKPTTPSTLYNVELTDKYWKYGKIVAKLAFLYVSIIGSVLICIRVYKSSTLTVNTGPIEQGIYDIKHFSLNGDSTITDSLQWKDLALYGVIGSIKTADTIFVQRYNRGYFSFEVDSVAKQLKIKRNYADSTCIMSLNYEIPGKGTLELTGKLRADSLSVVLTKSKKKFRLAAPDRFHWLQESPQ